jgi:hypothetical protein
MGFIRHHTIVVTTFNEALLVQAHQQAVAIFGEDCVSGITGEYMNGYASFFVAPDGGNEWRDRSNRCDEERDDFIEWLDAQRYEDGSTDLDWIEVEFGGDGGSAQITREGG